MLREGAPGQRGGGGAGALPVGRPRVHLERAAERGRRGPERERGRRERKGCTGGEAGPIWGLDKAQSGAYLRYLPPTVPGRVPPIAL